MSSYYDERHLSRIAEIGDSAPLLWKRFQDWYFQVFSNNSLSRRDKSLIALAVAHAERCPYSVDAYTEECLEQGYSEAQMTEAVQVAAVVRSGSSLMHGLQMKDAVDRLRKREE